MDTPVDELLPTRRSLVSRLKNWEDQESWRDFFNTYWKLIYGVAIKAGLNDAAAQDVVQETLVSVSKRIQQFNNDPRYGSFKAWLLTITRRRIIDHLRRMPASLLAEACSAEDSSTPIANRIPDPASLDWNAVWETDWQRNLMDAALGRVKIRVKARQYQIFDCFVLKGWPMREVTRKLRVSMGQVYFAKYKISALIQKEIRELEKKIT